MVPRIQRNTATSGTLVLRQNPDADLPGCNADDEGENDRGLTASEHQNPTAQPGTACQIEFRLIHVPTHADWSSGVDSSHDNQTLPAFVCLLDWPWVGP